MKIDDMKAAINAQKGLIYGRYHSEGEYCAVGALAVYRGIPTPIGEANSAGIGFGGIGEFRSALCDAYECTPTHLKKIQITSDKWGVSGDVRKQAVLSLIAGWEDA